MLGTALIAVTMFCLALVRGGASAAAVFLTWFRHDMTQTSSPLLVRL